MRKLFAVLLLLLIAVSADAASVGNAVATITRLETRLVRYDITWTSTAGGAVSGNPIALRGRLLQVELVPAPGANQPTNLYGVTLVDASGADYLAGAGASQSNVNAKLVVLVAPAVVDTNLDVVVSAAGASKKGRVILWIEVE